MDTLTIKYVGPHDEVILPLLGRSVAQGETVELSGEEEVAFGRGLLMQGATAVLDDEGNHLKDESGADRYQPTYAHWAPMTAEEPALATAPSESPPEPA